MVPTFHLLLSKIRNWKNDKLMAFEYEDSDEYGLVRRRREPTQNLRSWGRLFAMSVEAHKIRLLYWSPEEPTKHIFIFIKSSTWKFGTVTFCWIEKRSLGTWEWDSKKGNLDPSIEEKTGIDKAASEMKKFLQSLVADKNTANTKTVLRRSPRLVSH